jgi:hypothetical protein
MIGLCNILQGAKSLQKAPNTGCVPALEDRERWGPRLQYVFNGKLSVENLCVHTPTIPSCEKSLFALAQIAKTKKHAGSRAYKP